MGRNKLTTEEFINRAKSEFGEIYDFSLVEYINIRTKIKIVCKEHGIFEITPFNMLYNHEGCPLCRFNKMAKTKSLTTQEFIKKAKKIHEDKYDYSLVKYINNKTPIQIICKKHGIFWQLPNNHLSKEGCKKCYLESICGVEYTT